MTAWMPLIEPATDLALIVILVWYRTKKKFKKERFKGIWGFLDGNIVEIIIAAMVLPDLLAMLSKFKS